MREIIKKPVIVVGLFLLVASLVFLLGYVTDLPYFRDSELGWIWTTMIAGIVTLFSGISTIFRKEKSAL